MTTAITPPTRPLRLSQLVHRINTQVRTTVTLEMSGFVPYYVFLMGQDNLYFFQITQSRSVKKRLQVLTCFDWQTVADSECIKDSRGEIFYPAIKDDLFSRELETEFRSSATE